MDKKRKISSNDVSDLVSSEKLIARGQKFGVPAPAGVLTSEESRKLRIERFGEVSSSPSDPKKTKTAMEARKKRFNK